LHDYKQPYVLEKIIPLRVNAQEKLFPVKQKASVNLVIIGFLVRYRLKMLPVEADNPGPRAAQQDGECVAIINWAWPSELIAVRSLRNSICLWGESAVSGSSRK